MPRPRHAHALFIAALSVVAAFVALFPIASSAALAGVVVASTPQPCTPTPPPAPIGLTASALAPTSVTLRWTIVLPSAGCSPVAFDVLRAPGTSGGTFAVVGRTSLVDTFTDSTVAASSAYRYQVQSRSADGRVSVPSSTVAVTTPPGCVLVPPPAPGNLTATSVTPTTVSLTWAVTAAPGCSFVYDILRATGSDGAFTVVGTALGNSFTDTGLTPSTAYRYRARTRDAAGNISALSTTVAVTTGASGCAAAYRIVSAWSGGFQAEVTITNLTAVASTGWTATVTLSGAAIAAIWGGRTSQTSSPYTVTNETWNGVLAPNATAVVGFNAAMTGTGGASATITCILS